MAAKKTGSINAAKELVQEVFISFHQRKNELQTTATLKAYLYTALKNKIYNHFHTHLTRLKHEMGAVQDRKTEADLVDKIYESKELQLQIHEKIQALPPQCRKVFLMSREEQLPYKEIAAKLNISVNTVDQHIQKALRILRSSVDLITVLYLLWIKNL